MAIVKSLLEWASQELRASSTTARLDAELLFSKVSGLTRVQIISAAYESVDLKVENVFRELIARRKRFEPVAYITGKKEFYGLEFEVNQEVLVPRPESELLVELVLDATDKLSHHIRIIDLGTGSGCLAITIAKELEKRGRDFHVTAIDCEDGALKLAQKNAERLGISSKLSFQKSNWFSSVSKEERFDIIVSNPPYIAENDQGLSQETTYEPKRALFAGKSGLDCISELLLKSPLYLKNPGRLYCEMGHQHRHAVENLTKQLFNTPEKGIVRLNFSPDLAGHDRVFEIEI